MSLPVRIILVLAGTLVWLGLAIAAYGGPAAFFAVPALVALCIVQIAMALAALFAGGNLSAGEKEDRGNRWVLAAFAVLGLLLGVVPAWTDRHDLWTIGGPAIRWIGIVLFAAGGALRLWPVAVLGNRFSGLVAIQPGHTLVTTGIYRTIRNPSYLGLLLGSLGWSLAFRSVAGIVITALHLVPLIARMDAEERLLAANFGAEYEAYRARTWRLIPHLY
jgi:protein-S-isoprenylcysteine O-methyltransferase Ste14